MRRKKSREAEKTVKQGKLSMLLVARKIQATENSFSFPHLLSIPRLLYKEVYNNNKNNSFDHESLSTK